MRRVAVVMPAAPCFFVQQHNDLCGDSCGAQPALSARSPARWEARRTRIHAITPAQEAAARGARLRELRWKNRAWLATAETIAGWNGFEIRNAGSGRSPVRKRSG